jgi:hypothetical protein
MNLNSITQETLEKIIELTGQDELSIRHKVGFFLKTSAEFPEIERIERIKSVEEAIVLYRDLIVHRRGDIVEKFFLKKLANLIQNKK